MLKEILSMKSKELSFWNGALVMASALLAGALTGYVALLITGYLAG